MRFLEKVRAEWRYGSPCVDTRGGNNGKEADGADVMHEFGLHFLTKFGLRVTQVPMSVAVDFHDRVPSAWERNGGDG